MRYRIRLIFRFNPLHFQFGWSFMKRLVLFPLILFFINCENEKAIPHNSVQTALGELKTIIVKKEICVNNKIIRNEPGQILLLLKFYGKSEIPYQSAGMRDDYYMIIDSTLNFSSHYVPVFVGAFDSTKKLSDEFDKKMNGAVTVHNGITVFSGTIQLANSEVVLLYKISADYHELYLQENGQKLALLKNN
jgi:hypothetical protein